MAPPPPPFHILRAHSAPLSSLTLTPNNLLAGDQDGYVSITSLQTRRTTTSWLAHEGGVLSVQEWDGQIVTQGRDNTIKFYDIPRDASPPKELSSMPSNALNFCRMSIAKTGDGGLLAVPNLTDSEYVDIYALPSMKRIGAAVNYSPPPPKTSSDAVAAEGRSGLVMGLHVAVREGKFTLVVGYEDGRVEVWQPESEEEWNGRKGSGWIRKWEGKAHNEAVMAMVVDPACAAAFTVSADHVIVRVDIGKAMKGEEAVKKYSSKSIGNGAMAVSADGRLLAVGGWDGKIRLYSAATLKPLGTLAYHRESVQALAFGPEDREDESVLELGEDSDSEEEQGSRATWLASGGNDRRIALWDIKIGGIDT